MRSKRTLAALLAASAALLVGGVSLAGAREAEPGDDRSPRPEVVDATPTTVDDSPTVTVDGSSPTTVDDSPTSPDDSGRQNRGPDDHGRNRGPGGPDRADDDRPTATSVDDNDDAVEDDGVHQCRGCDDGADDGPDHDVNDDTDDDRGGDHSGRGPGGDDSTDDHSGRG